MQKNNTTLQFFITPHAGKRLIAKAFICIPEILGALENKTIAIIAGTTNGYIAQELLAHIGQSEGFSRNGFYRGITLPPHYRANNPTAGFTGDVVLEKGKWEKGKTIFDVAAQLTKGDIILKGANALDMINRKAAVMIGHPEGGTIMAALTAVIGKRSVLYIPVGLEKRVCGNLDEIAASINSPAASGPRLIPIQGTIITELDAINVMTGCKATLIAAGGICGAEGGYWIAVTGTEEQVSKAAKIIRSVEGEPPCTL
ncbi:MAG: hypothetical protein GX144_10090 [Clostridiaceae bacterium]|jgi:hypothetical protein|nr:hypothetical protein [Clostridiaceae bacterium]